MKPKVTAYWICFLLLAGNVARQSSALGSGPLVEWQAGAARLVITPTERIWMAGYGSRSHVAEGKLTELYAKALVLEDARRQRVVLVTMDLVGIDRQLSQRICQELAERYQLQRQQIALCCSHTHSGPVVGRNLEPLHYRQLTAAQQRQIDEYAEHLLSGVVRLVGQALESMAPARLRLAQGSADFAVNRRNNPEPQVVRLRAAGKLAGPVDHHVPILAVEDSQGALRAVVFGYACHATVLSSYQWCGDYPGYAQRALEEAFPGAVAMFWAGCGADINPLPRRTVELAQQYGQQLALAVQHGLSAAQPPLAAQLECSYQEAPAPLAPAPPREQWVQRLKSEDRYERARAQGILDQWDAGRPPPATYPYPVACWTLGGERELTWLFLGGEVVVDYAIKLQELMAPRTCWVAGYSNDVMAYIPSLRVLREGGYEGGGAMVYYGLPTVWAPELETTILAEARRQAAWPRAR